MRKYIIGALVGAALMMGVQAGASDLLTGSKVAGTKKVTFNGKSIGQAAIINNSSYLPVRAVSDAIGLQIDLSGGSINLSDSSSNSTGSTGTPIDSGQTPPASLNADQIQQQIAEIDQSIERNNEIIKSAQAQIDALVAQGHSGDTAIWQYAIDGSKAALEKLYAQKADLEAQLQALQNQ